MYAHTYIITYLILNSHPNFVHHITSSWLTQSFSSPKRHVIHTYTTSSHLYKQTVLYTWLASTSPSAFTTAAFHLRIISSVSSTLLRPRRRRGENNNICNMHPISNLPTKEPLFAQSTLTKGCSQIRNFHSSMWFIDLQFLVMHHSTL